MLITPSLKMAFVFLCLCLITTVTSRSLLDLETQLDGIRATLERGENTRKQQGLEISELKKELNSVYNRPNSSDRLNKLKQKLVMVSSQLDSLKSGQETAKIERNGISEDLRQVNRWSKALISNTERNWEKAIANVSTGNCVKELDYQEFKKHVLKEWDQWWSHTKETVSRVVAEFEQSKADLQAQQTEIQAEFEKFKADLLEQQSKIEAEFGQSKAVLRAPQPSPIEAELKETKPDLQAPQNQTRSGADSSAKHIHCLMECGEGWIKYGCICYKAFKERVPFDEAKNQCEGLGARLLYPQEFKSEMLTKAGVRFVWVGVRKEGDQPLKYINGTEAELSIVSIFKDYCVLASSMTLKKKQFFTMDCKYISNFICVKTQHG